MKQMRDFEKQVEIETSVARCNQWLEKLEKDGNVVHYSNELVANKFE